MRRPWRRCWTDNLVPSPYSICHFWRSADALHGRWSHLSWLSPDVAKHWPHVTISWKKYLQIKTAPHPTTQIWRHLPHTNTNVIFLPLCFLLTIWHWRSFHYAILLLLLLLLQRHDGFLTGGLLLLSSAFSLLCAGGRRWWRHYVPVRPSFRPNLVRVISGTPGGNFFKFLLPLIKFLVSLQNIAGPFVGLWMSFMTVCFLVPSGPVSCHSCPDYFNEHVHHHRLLSRLLPESDWTQPVYLSGPVRIITACDWPVQE